MEIRQWFTPMNDPISVNVSPPVTQFLLADFNGGSDTVDVFVPQVGSWTLIDSITPAEHVILNNMWTVNTAATGTPLRMLRVQQPMVVTSRYTINALLNLNNLINAGSHFIDLVFMRNVNGVVVEVRVALTLNTINLQIHNSGGVATQVALAQSASVPVFVQIDFLGTNQVRVVATAQGQTLQWTQTYIGVMPQLAVYQWSITTAGQVKPGILQYAVTQS